MELDGTTIVRVPLLLDSPAIHSLRSALDSAIASSARSVVLTGSEQGFCKGLDLAGLESNTTDIENTVESFASSLELIRLSSKPVVAFVDGKAIGGGVGLVAACDIALATTNSSFELPELLFRLTPAIILPYLALRMGPQKTKWMAMTAETIAAERALDIGLVDACCDSAHAAASLKKLLRRLNRLDPEAVESWKEMTARLLRPGSRDGIVWTTSRLRDAKVRQSIVDFIETGTPPWMQ